MKNIISLILFVSFFIISCDMETVIDLDIPPHESVLVLNGLLDTDTNARVVVSHSVGAFSNAVPSFINNANVLLYKEDQFIDSLLPDLTNLIYVKYYDDYNEVVDPQSSKYARGLGVAMDLGLYIDELPERLPKTYNFFLQFVLQSPLEITL